MTETKPKAHLHAYGEHPRPEWRATHVACEICGFAIPKALLPYAIEHGAERARDATCPSTFRGHRCFHDKGSHPPLHEDLNGWCWSDAEAQQAKEAR